MAKYTRPTNHKELKQPGHCGHNQSTNKCRRHGCSRFALNGSDICEDCWADNQKRYHGFSQRVPLEQPREVVLAEQEKRGELPDERLKDPVYRMLVMGREVEGREVDGKGSLRSRSCGGGEGLAV